MDYQHFLENKKHLIGSFGFDCKFIPDIAFDFQKHVIQKSIEKGRIANFLDTGLGKTLIQISEAYNVVLHTNKRVLILTPLAVSFQFMKEAEKIGIDDIEISKDGKFTKKIVISNYERLHYFNPNDFVCLMLDESSILKNFEGKIKQQVTTFIKKLPYRFLSTATPSPNDFIELGTSSEALGYLGYMDMLSTFFKNNQNDTGGRDNVGNKFYLKKHAENDFFSWVNQWAIMVKIPSDIGFSDEKYNLPKLTEKIHVVKNQSLIDVDGQIQMFTPIARTMTEVRHEQKQTEIQRCEKAYELANGKTSVYWCNTINESFLLKEIDSDAYEIKGSQSIEQKEEILLAFANCEFERLITKAKITGMGLNWQHCNHSVFFPTWSYEQKYQALRRFWRFGQKREVTFESVISDGQQRVLDTLERKQRNATILYSNLIRNVNKSFSKNAKEFNEEVIKPKFL